MFILHTLSSAVLQKMVYPGNRRFLKHNDHLHHDVENFPSKHADLTEPPELKTTEYVDSANVILY